MNKSNEISKPDNTNRTIEPTRTMRKYIFLLLALLSVSAYSQSAYPPPSVLLAKPGTQFTSLVVTRYSNDRFNITGSVDKWSNIYVYTVANGSGAPSSATVKASGTSSLATSYFTIEQSGLTADTEYDVYVVAETQEGKLQPNPTKLDVRTAKDLNTVYGSNLKFWLKGRAKDNKTVSGTWDQIVSATTSGETSGLAFSNSGSGGATTKYNGKGFYFFSAGLQGATDKTRLNSVHQGGPFTIAFRYMPVVDDITTVNPIINNNNNTTGKVGFSVTCDDRAAQGREDALDFMVSKASAGNSNLRLIIDNFFTVRQYTTCVIIYDGVNTVTAYKNGTSAGSATSTNLPFSSADASDDISVGKFSVSATYSTYSALTDVVVLNTALNTSDRNALEAFLEQYTSTLGSSGDANLYVSNGQSNSGGDLSTSSPPSYLSSAGAMKTFIGNTTSNTNVSSLLNYIPLEYGVSTSTENSTFWGPELEFGYRMAEFVPNVTFISKYAIGGTSLAVNPSGNDWNTTSGASEAANQSSIHLRHSYSFIKYALDRDVTVRGWLWRQGETDAIAGNSDYTTQLYALQNKHIDELITWFGYTSSKCRGLFSLIDGPFGPPAVSRPFAGAITTSLINAANNYFTDNPSYVGKWHRTDYFSTADLPLADGTHFTSTAQATHGFRFFEYFKKYISE